MQGEGRARIVESGPKIENSASPQRRRSLDGVGSVGSHGRRPSGRQVGRGHERLDVGGGGGAAVGRLRREVRVGGREVRGRLRGVSAAQRCDCDPLAERRRGRARASYGGRRRRARAAGARCAPLACTAFAAPGGRLASLGAP